MALNTDPKPFKILTPDVLRRLAEVTPARSQTGCRLKSSRFGRLFVNGENLTFHLQQITPNFVARPHYSYPLYSAQIITPDLVVLQASRETLPQLVAWCAEQVLAFDSYQRVRRELGAVGIYARGYRLSKADSSGFVLISLVKD